MNVWLVKNIYKLRLWVSLLCSGLTYLLCHFFSSLLQVIPFHFFKGGRIVEIIYLSLSHFEIRYPYRWMLTWRAYLRWFYHVDLLKGELLAFLLAFKSLVQHLMRYAAHFLINLLFFILQISPKLFSDANCRRSLLSTNAYEGQWMGVDVRFGVLVKLIWRR